MSPRPSSRRAPLDQGRAETEILQHGEEGHGDGRHSHDPELLRRQQPGEDGGGNQYDALAEGKGAVVPEDSAYGLPR